MEVDNCNKSFYNLIVYSNSLIYNDSALNRRRMKLNPNKPIIRFTQMRWSNVFVESSNEILHEVLCCLGVKDIIATKYEIYGSQALDPHVNRERFRDNLWA